MQLTIDFTSTETKFCLKCQSWKTLDAFNKCKTRKDGLGFYCRECLRKPASPPLIDENGFRLCPQCKIRKHVDQWVKNTSRKHDIGSKCLACHSTKEKLRRLRISKIEKPILSTGEKRCSECHIFLTYDNFSRNRYSLDGYHNSCKTCCSTRHHNWRINNLDHVRALDKKYWKRKREKMREYRKRTRPMHRATHAAWRAKNRDRARCLARRYRERHIDLVRERFKKWARRPHGIALMRIYQHKRRVKIRENGWCITPAEWIAICAKYDQRCLCCGEAKPLVMDHIIPVSKGGLNIPDNFQPLCQTCNLRKGTKSTDYRLKQEMNP